MTTISILHLSDIHIRSAEDPVLAMADKVASAAFPYGRDVDILFIVVSGDIAFSGLSEQYVLAEAFLNQIKSVLTRELSCRVELMIAPGNHDCDFNSGTATRDVLVEQLTGPKPPRVDDSVIESCLIVQGEFLKFRERLQTDKPVGIDNLWTEHHYDHAGKTIVFDIFNVPWVSKLNEESKLYFPIDRYAQREWEVPDLRVAIFHHPLNWYSQSAYRPFRTYIRRLANIVVTGHEHQGNVGIIQDTDSGESAYVEGCVLQEDGSVKESALNVVQIDLALDQFRSTRFLWNGTQYGAAEDGSWSSYRELPLKAQDQFALQDSFLDYLEDTGAYFWRGTRDISLSDIYVYPDLKPGDIQEERQVRISAQKLLQPKNLASGVIISGEEKSGRSSLLHRLYQHYHDRGFLPVLLDARRLRRATAENVDAAVSAAVAEQYGPARVEAFEQEPKSKKLLLVDNFDDSTPISKGGGRTIVDAFKARFGQYVITVADGFELRELIATDDEAELRSIEHYQIQPLGYVLRSKLIEKWFRLPDGEPLSASEVAGACDRAEKLVTVAMTRGVIPSVPLYLLTLLQSIEGGHSGEFRESALGYYYQYLMTEALQKNKVRPEKFTEIFQYCAQLAWYFHSNDADELTEIELRKFNEGFCREWHTVDFRERLALLTEARFLRQRDDRYSFRYPYIYYYFKGKYLSENLAQMDVRAYISRCCEHLYVRDYANTVLFLVHHTNDDFVLVSIGDALRSVFRNRAPITFAGDTGPIKGLIESGPQLMYSGGKPEVHREQRNRVRDEIEGDDALRANEESGVLSLGSQLMMMSKTVQILGQVLKNQYSRIPRRRKRDLLAELFNAPLRAVSDFIAFFEKFPDVLTAEIDLTLQRKAKVTDDKKRREIAAKVVALVVEFVTWGLLAQVVESVSSDDLREDVADTARRNGSLAYRLIDLGVDLDSPKSLPRRKIRELHRDVAHEIVPASLLRIALLNRLYMFRTSESDMLWLNNEMGFEMAAQRAINLKKRTRRLK